MVFPNHVFLVNMDLLTAELFWKLYVPQRYVHELERYWKKSDFIGVENFC